MRLRRFAWIILLLLACGIGGFIWYSQHDTIDGIEPPAASSFDPALVQTGARLAALGNCRYCHTAANAPDFAGGRPIATPFGTVYSSNITPARGSGIGQWPQAAFDRAMRHGISRRGHHLYPAFPYDHFARLNDADLRALYAFLMTRTPAQNFPPPNQLQFPFSQRWVLAFWNALFLSDKPFQPDPKQSDEWNRGAYLVAGIGHCGACHTPRNALGGENSSAVLSGGEAEGWSAPALNAASPAPVPWDADHLFTYLRQGWDDRHGAAAGPMQAVTEELSQASEADIRAIATYLAAQQGDIAEPRRKRAETALARAAAPQGAPKPGRGEELGAGIFAGACAACHTGKAEMVPPRGIDLALSSALSEPDPRNAIRIVMDGIQPRGEQPGPLMPAFRGTFADTQLAALLQYLRVHYGPGPSWANLEAAVRDVRKEDARRDDVRKRRAGS